jgi:hypothetical protein
VVESLGDAVVFGEAPHASDLLTPGGESGCQSEPILVLDSHHPIAINTDSVKHTGHGGDLPRPMSPFFDQEPEYDQVMVNGTLLLA